MTKRTAHTQKPSSEKRTKKSANYTPSNKQTKGIAEHDKTIRGHSDQKPVWRLGIVDTEHPKWGWKNLKDPQSLSILDKLRSYESMTWNEIVGNKKRDHSVSIESLCVEAKKRLSKLKLDDFSDLFRFRFEGKQRMWGIKEGFIFKILWWDPEHTVDSSNKKHT